jgi:hypothetical protein
MKLGGFRPPVVSGDTHKDVFWASLAYSTNTSKYRSSSNTPVSINSYSNSSRERLRFVFDKVSIWESTLGVLYKYFM